MSCSSYQFQYFSIRGRGEIIRLMLHATSTPFEDIKVAPPQFGALKSSLPFGQLPILSLEIDSKKVTFPQSIAMIRHLARVCNRYGASEEEHIRVDFLLDSVTDMRNRINAQVYYPNFCKDQEATLKMITEILPPFLNGFENQLALNQSNSPFFIGNDWTGADIVFFDSIDVLNQVDVSFLKAYPFIAAHYAAVSKISTLTQYLQSRGVSEIVENKKKNNWK